jgi:hypothetical protein
MDRVGMFVLYLMQCGTERGENFKNFEFCGRKIEIVKFLLAFNSTCSCLAPSIVAKCLAQLLVTLLFGVLIDSIAYFIDASVVRSCVAESSLPP